MVTFDLPKGHILNLDKIEKISICGMKKKKNYCRAYEFCSRQMEAPREGDFKLLMIYLVS